MSSHLQCRSCYLPRLELRGAASTHALTMTPKPKGEDGVSLSQVRDLLMQQKYVHMQLLTQQENNFKCFVQILVDSTNKRMDDMIKEVHDLKISLQFSQKEVEDLKETCRELNTKNKDARTDISTISISLNNDWKSRLP